MSHGTAASQSDPLKHNRNIAQHTQHEKRVPPARASI
jgi:hypothetical protein